MSGVRFYEVIAVLVICVGCSGSIQCPGTNVLLVSIDTCRADRTSPYGYDKIETPTLDTLAKAGILFEEAITPVPLTGPAHASLLTGWHPARHGVRDNANYTLSTDARTLAEIFQANGYATAGFVATMLLSRQRGFDQGFDTFSDDFPPTTYFSMVPTPDRRAEDIGKAVIEWLEDNDRFPFFLFVHFYDPHLPYAPPSPWSTTYRQRPYDGEIAYTDYHLGQILVWMQEHGILKDTLAVVTADHGESLWEHHEMAHGIFLYDCALHVPLIVRLPDRVRPPQLEGARVRGAVNLLDIVPSILELEGIPCPDVDGTSFVPCLMGKRREIRLIYAESLYPLFFNWSPLHAIRDYPWKFILAPEPELYNLADDAKEEKNLYSEDHPEVKRLKPMLEEEITRLEGSTHVAEFQPQQAEILASLGYAAGGTIDSATLPQLPDPKTKTRIYVLIDEGLTKMARGDFRGAETNFIEAAKQDPENPSPYLNLGDIYGSQQQWAKALLCTQRTLDLAPNNLWARIQMAVILMEMKRYDEARERLLRIREEQPRCAIVQFSLGRIAEAGGKYEEALQWYSETLKLMPNMSGLRQRMREAQEKMASATSG